MTDYNDGKWHDATDIVSWPVHEKSMVARAWLPYDSAVEFLNFGSVRSMDWSSEYGRTTAFRVVKPYREPRTFWAVDTQLFQTQAEAKSRLARATVHYTSRGLPAPQIIKLVEVLE